MTIEQLKPLTEGHPYEYAVEAIASRGEERNRKGRSWISQIDIATFESPSMEVLAPLFSTSPQQASEINSRMWKHSDYTSVELRDRLTVKNFENDWPEWIAHLKRVSPREPRTLQLRISLQAQESQSEFPLWEKQFDDSAATLRELSFAYKSLGDVKSAERCALRVVALEPTHGHYANLASLYSLQGDYDKWLAALQASINTPSPGLERTDSLIRIAEYYYERGDFEEAARYATRAARSGAGGALNLASKTYEKLGDWKTSESLTRAIAQRYSNWGFEWFLWCLRTGHGDLKSATELARSTAREISTNPSLEEKGSLARFYLMSNESEKAFSVVLDIARDPKNQFHVIHWYAFLLADELGNKEARNEILKRLVALDYTDVHADLTGTQALALHFNERIGLEDAAPDLEWVQKEIAKLPHGPAREMSYIVGRYLLNHGNKQDAINYLRFAASSSDRIFRIPIHATAILRTLGEDVPEEEMYPVRPQEWSPSTSDSNMIRHLAPSSGATFVESTETALAWDAKGNLINWDLGQNKETVVRAGDELGGTVHGTTRDGKRWLFSKSFSEELTVWNVEDSKPWKSLPRKGAKQICAAFSPTDSNKLFRVDARYKLDDFPSASLSYWDVEQVTEKWNVDFGDFIPVGARWKSEDIILVWGRTRDGAGWIAEYASKDGERKRITQLPKHEIAEFSVSANRQFGVSRSSYGEIIRWDLERFEPGERFWRSGVTALALSPDASIVVLGHSDGRIDFIDIRANRSVASCRDHQQAITHLNFDDNGQRLLSGANDYTTRSWNVADILSKTDQTEKDSTPLLAMTNGLGMTLIPVPQGEFQMGERDGFTPTKGFRSNTLKFERPRRAVMISKPYYLSQNEVTVAQFRKFIDATGYVTDAERDGKGGYHYVPPNATPVLAPGLSWRSPGFDQADQHPVVMVTHNDANAFCKWLTDSEKQTYRLPTEAEWEKACRAGTDSSWHYGNEPYIRRKAYGNNADAAIKRHYNSFHTAWYIDDKFPFTAPVGSFTPNPYGLYDMNGNVLELCKDRYAEDYYSKSPKIDPQGPDEGELFVIRGGSFLSHPEDSRAAFRDSNAPDEVWSAIGFRVLKEVEK